MQTDSEHVHATKLADLVSRIPKHFSLHFSVFYTILYAFLKFAVLSSFTTFLLDP